jgi:hypothetical protein
MNVRTVVRRLLRRHRIVLIVTTVILLLIAASGFMHGPAELVTFAAALAIEFVQIIITVFTSLRGQWRRRHGAKARIRRAYAARCRSQGVESGK